MDSIVEVILRVRDQASGALRQVQATAREVRGSLEAVRRSAVEANEASQQLAVGIGALAAAMTGLGAKAVSTFGDIEQAQISFEGLLGSAQKAETFLRELYDFAARTPFEIQGLQDQSRRLIAMGFSVEKVIPTLRVLGDAVAAMGGSAATLDRVVLAISQIQAKGRVQAEEMLQLAEAGIPVWEMLSQKIGVSIPEAMERVEKGVVSASTALNALVEGMDSRFRGAMERQSRSVLGTWSNIKDAIYQTLGAIGESIDRTFRIREGMSAFLSWLQRFLDFVRGGGLDAALSSIGNSAQYLAAALVGALLPALLRAADAVRLLISRLGPWAAAATAVVAALKALGVNLGEIAEQVVEFGSRVVRIWGPLKDAVVAALSIALEKVSAFFSSFRAAPSYAAGLLLTLVAPIKGFIQMVEQAAKAVSHLLSGDFAGASKEARSALPWVALGKAMEDAQKKFAEGTAVIRERMREAGGTIAVLEEDLANAIYRISQAWNSSTEGTKKFKEGVEQVNVVVPKFTEQLTSSTSVIDRVEKKKRTFADALSDLRAKYEAGLITQNQFVASLKGMIPATEAAIKKNREGTEAWRDAVRTLADVKRLLGELTDGSRAAAESFAQAAGVAKQKYESFLRALEATQLSGVEDLRIALLDAARLEELEGVNSVISQIEERLAQPGLTEAARNALQELNDEAEKLSKTLTDRLLKALEAEQEEKLRAALSYYKAGEEAAEAFYEGYTSRQYEIITQVYRELEQENLDALQGILTQLEQEVSSARVAVAQGIVAPKELPDLLSEAAKRAGDLAKALYEAGELSAEGFEQVQRSIHGVTDLIVKHVLDSVSGLKGTLGLNEFGEALADNISYLQELQSQVPRGTEQYRLLEDAVARLRVEYLQLFPVVQQAHTDLAVPPPVEDYYDVVAGVKSFHDELEALYQALQAGESTQEEFNRSLDELKDRLNIIRPVWESWIRGQESAGVQMEDSRKALQELDDTLQSLDSRVKALARTRFEDWLRGLSESAQTAFGAVRDLFSAIGSSNFGSFITPFTRGIGSLVGMFSKTLGSLIPIIGDIFRSLWEGLRSLFDSGEGEVNDRLKRVAQSFTLLSQSAFEQAREHYTESYIWGLIKISKQRVNEAMLAVLQAVGGALDSGVVGAMRNAMRAFLQGAQDWASVLRQGIREAIENAVIEAVLRGTIVKGALGNLLDNLTGVLAKGDFGTAQGIIQQISSAIPNLTTQLESLLTPLRGVLEESFGSEVAKTAEKAKETFLAITQAVGGALESGVVGAMRNAIQTFLRGAQDWATVLRKGIREAIESAVIEAVLQGGIIKGALGELLNRLSETLAKGDYTSARSIIQRITSSIPELASRLEDLLSPLRGVLNESFGSSEENNTPGYTSGRTQSIVYNLPTVSMGSPAWVDEMGRHVATFGSYVDRLVRDGVRVRSDFDLAWRIRGVFW